MVKDGVTIPVVPPVFPLDDVPVIGCVVVPDALGDACDDDPGSLVKFHGELVGPDWRSWSLSEGQNQ